MKLNLNMEIGKKAATYPTKKTINLYYKDDVSSRISTIILDVIFVAVVVIGLAKILVVDVIVDRNAALDKVEKAQTRLEQQLDVIADYDEVSAEYVRYSHKILVDSYGVQDRLEILEMLENTVYKNSSITNVTISGNAISLSFDGLDLNATAQLIEELEAYEMVSSVKINSQNGNTPNESYSGNMIITLVQPGGTQ